MLASLHCLFAEAPSESFDQDLSLIILVDELDGSQFELLGLYVNRKEFTNGLIARVDQQGDRWLPVATLAEAIGLTITYDAESVVLQTPLGVVKLSNNDLRKFGNEILVEQAYFTEQIVAKSDFHPADYSLNFQLLWNPQKVDIAETGANPIDPIRPQVTAPIFDLSRIRGEFRTSEAPFQDVETTGFLEFYGRAGHGAFQGRLRQNTEGDFSLRDYQWRVQAGDLAGLIGHERVGAHRLLNSFDLTGAQVAWSNVPEQLLIGEGSRRSGLVTNQISPVRDLRGVGPAGGIAELRIDGVVVDQQRIPLDGEFEFVDVDVPAGVAQVEVSLSQPFASATPESVIDFSDRSSGTLLSRGTAVISGGLGLDSNPLDDFQSNESANLGVFAQTRYGVNERLTLEAGAQSYSEGTQGVLGFVGNLGPLALVSGAYAQSGSFSSSQFALDGEYDQFFWRGSFRTRDADFREGDEEGFTERRGEIGWRYSRGLELGLIGRDRSGFGTDASFILPSIMIRPVPQLLIRSRPNSFGDYVHDLRWRFNRETRLNAQSTEDFSRVSLDHRWSSNWSTTLSTVHDRNPTTTLYSFVNTIREDNPYGWRADLGVLASSINAGGFVRLEREVLPGLRLRAEARREPERRGSFNSGGNFFSLTASFDFSRASGGFTRSSSIRSNSGSIGGRIIGAGRKARSLEGVGVNINGRLLAESDAYGRFSVSDLEPDIYEVSVDESQLPLELNTAGGSRWVEVAQGASTLVDFEVSLQLGAAGAVKALTNDIDHSTLHVIVRDKNGVVITQSALSPFAYWRVDSLAPGTYTAALVGPEGKIIAQRTLVLIDNFIFEQDFDLEIL